VNVVILAGGKGTRLSPYTTVFPKPLMPIGDKPILEIIINQLKAQGFKDITMAVGHLSELIMAFFGGGSRFGVNITYSREEEPLGTVGGLGLIKDKLNDTFMIINGDTLTSLQYSDLFDWHNSNSAVATIALNKRQLKIDFGLVEVDNNNQVQRYTEKPNLENLVSMGVSILQPEVLDYIQPNEPMDFPKLIQDLLNNGKKVMGYIYEGFWLDIGRPSDYEKANTEIDDIFSLLGINKLP
jgi:NDP-sugar pyrophosphorylase family protein